MVRIVFSLAALSTLMAEAGSLVLADRHLPVSYAIILNGAEAPSRRYAATELHDWTERLTGVKLPVLREPKEGMHSIFLDLPSADDDLGEEGFKLKAAANDLHIVGGKRGILYGVYELLETYGGIGWYASWRTVVPKSDRLAIPEDLDVTQKPAFCLRSRSWYDPSRNPDFACRIRMNGKHQFEKPGAFEEKHGGCGWRIGDRGCCHTLAGLLPLGVYGKIHPEYYAEINGSRRVVGKVQPCLTNPDVLRIVTSNLLERIRRDPTAECFDVSQNDYPNFCTCEKCKAIDDEEGSHSGTMIRFVNAVAEAVEKEFPEKLICTLAYRYTRKPPRHVKPRRNVLIRLCPIECDFSAPLGTSRYHENIAFERDLAEWAKISSNLYVWDYSTNFNNYLHSFPNARVLLANMRKFRDYGARYLLEQGASLGLHADFGELKVWLIAKGMWNPDRDTDELIDRFMNGYYGAAAPYARACFDLLNAQPTDTAKFPALIYESAWDRRRLSDEVLERAAELWERAADVVKDDPECLHNVKMSAAGVSYTQLERMVAGVKRFWITRDPGRFVSDSRLPKMVDRMRRFEQDSGGVFRYAEGSGMNASVSNRWQVALETKVSGEVADRIVIGTEGLELERPGKFGISVADPKAKGGRAFKIFSTQYGWCLRFRFRYLAYDSGVKYFVRIHAKAQKTGTDGEIFSAGLYDSYQKTPNIAERKFSTRDMSDDYAWYDIGSLAPSDAAIVWLSAAEPPKNNNPYAAKSFMIDSIEISRVE